MAARTTIEWTEATWNPVTGCTKVSPGCDNCYAETIAHRFAGTKAYPDGFAPTLRPERLTQPLRWTRPRRIFVCSMADLFHDDVPDDYLEQVFDVMEQANWHTFQVLTKRHARMRSFLRGRQARRDDYAAQFSCPTEAMRTSPAARWPQNRADNPPPNIWVGVSAENQQWADIRIPALLDTPAAVRWISAEPLLGPLDLSRWLGLEHYDSFGWGEEMFAALQGRVGPAAGLHWVVAGGESGRGARPMHPDWARSLRDQCAAAGVSFLLKQHGEWAPIGPLYDQDDVNADDARMDAVQLEVVEKRQVVQLESSGEVIDPEAYQPQDPRTWLMAGVGKKAAGRELDGRLHDGYPTAVSA